MPDARQEGAGNGASAGPGWLQALEDLERSLRDASWAMGLLRRSLEAGAPGRAAIVAPPALPPARALAAVPPPEPPGQSEEEGSGAGSPFERLWDRLEQERRERHRQGTTPAAERRGLELLPHYYLMTVEDRESRIDLAALHRALVALSGMEEVALASFVNGVPVVSLRMQGELDPDRLTATVGSAMDRDCEVIVQDTGKLFLRLKSRRDGGG